MHAYLSSTAPAGAGQVVSAERVHAARPGIRALAHWTSLTPAEGAEMVRGEIFGAAETLPPVWLLDGVVVPVVTWLPAELDRRRAREQGPVLSRSVLAQQLRDGRDSERPPVLSINAFIAVQPLRKAMSAMGWLAGYAAVAVALPSLTGADDWAAFECDYRGFTLVEVGPQGVRVKVRGPLTGRSAHQPVNHHLRLLQEQLFDVALRHDRVPGA